MKQFVTIIALLLIFLSACCPSPEDITAQTATAQTAVAAAWTKTPTITASPTSTSTPTPTITASPTPTPFPASAFNVEIVGYGEHGAMFELLYNGDISDLENIDLIKLDAYQDGKKQDQQVMQLNEGRYLAEMTDACYQLGDIQLELSLSSDSVKEDFELTTKFEQWYPFLRWLFGENGMDRNVGGGFPQHHMQWDLAFSSSDYPNSVGTPILAVSSLKVVNYTDSVPGKNGLLTNINTYIEDVGLVWNIGHVDHDTHPLVGSTFEPGEIIAYIDENQPAGSSRPHTHMGLNTTEIPLQRPFSNGENNDWINPFSHDPFADGSYLETGLWLPEYLPQEVIDLIEQGFFEAHTYVTNYSPGRSQKE